MTSPTSSDAPAGRNPWLIGGVIVPRRPRRHLADAFLTRSPEAASASPSASPSPSASGSPLPSQSASQSPEASEEPSEAPAPSDEPGPSPVVEAPEGVLPPGSVARVVVDGLRIRMEPSTDAEEVTTLGADELVVLGYSYIYPDFGPVEAGDTIWYPVGSLGITELPAPAASRSRPSTLAGWPSATAPMPSSSSSHRAAPTTSRPWNCSKA